MTGLCADGGGAAVAARRACSDARCTMEALVAADPDRCSLVGAARRCSLFPLVGGKFYLQLVAKIMIIAIFAMSLDLLVGFTGLVSLGHAAFFGLGAYALCCCRRSTQAANLWLSLPAAIARGGAGGARHRRAGAAHVGHLFHHGDARRSRRCSIYYATTPKSARRLRRHLHLRQARRRDLRLDARSTSAAAVQFYYVVLVAVLLVTYVLLRVVLALARSAVRCAASAPTSSACARSASRPSATSSRASCWPARSPGSPGYLGGGAVRLRQSRPARLAAVRQRADDGDPRRHGHALRPDPRRLRPGAAAGFPRRSHQALAAAAWASSSSSRCWCCRKDWAAWRSCPGVAPACPRWSTAMAEPVLRVVQLSQALRRPRRGGRRLARLHARQCMR